MDRSCRRSLALHHWTAGVHGCRGTSVDDDLLAIALVTGHARLQRVIERMNDAWAIAVSGGGDDLIGGLVEMLAHRGKARCASSHVLALCGLLLRPGDASS